MSERAERPAALSRIPARRVAVLTCIDARIDPLAVLGLSLGDAHVLRNAGAVVTDDVVRSLAVSTGLLGTREIVVLGHTDCGLEDFTDEQIRAHLAAAGVDASGIEFAAFADVEAAVRASVERLRAEPLLPRGTTVRGVLYEVATARVRTLA